MAYQRYNRYIFSICDKYCEGGNRETNCSDLDNICTDLCINSMYGVRHLSRRVGYGPDKSDQYLYGVYRPWLRNQASSENVSRPDGES